MAWYNPATWQVTNSIQGQKGGINAATIGKAVGYGNPLTALPTAIADVRGDASKAYNYTQTPAVGKIKNAAYSGNPTASAGQPPTGADSGAYGASSGPYSGSGSGTPDYSGMYRQQIQDKFKALQDVFNGLFGKIDNVYRQKAQDVNNQYNQQETDLGKTYQDTLNGTNLAYAGRGLGNSSYLGSALDQNTNIYQKNLNEIGRNRDNSNAQLGEALTGAKAGAMAQLGTYGDAMNNLGNYSEADLGNINSQIGSDLQNARVQSDTTLTNPEFQSRLASIAPSANGGSDALRTQLSNLVNSSAPVFAKRQIANTLIARQAQNPQDQTVWSNYFDSLLGGQA